MPLGPRCLITHLLALYKHAGRPSQFHICACIHNDRENRDNMAKRQERIDAFTHQGFPPADQPLELLCEDHVGTYDRFYVDGVAVLGTVWIPAAESKRRSSAGA